MKQSTHGRSCMQAGGAGSPRVAFFFVVQSAHIRQDGARNRRWSKKRAHAAVVRCARRWFPFPPPRAVIWRISRETELWIEAGGARDPEQARVSVRTSRCYNSTVCSISHNFGADYPGVLVFRAFSISNSLANFISQISLFANSQNNMGREKRSHLEQFDKFCFQKAKNPLSERKAPLNERRAR
jgi:hypothetical protein